MLRSLFNVKNYEEKTTEKVVDNAIPVPKTKLALDIEDFLMGRVEAQHVVTKALDEKDTIRKFELSDEVITENITGNIAK
ncbi:MAG: hypothetical protein N4A47_04910 [Clostridia bacterium]|jgi:hypothetical protein|nr:hypothetical protein [Clostridia bacterium]